MIEKLHFIGDQNNSDVLRRGILRNEISQSVKKNTSVEENRSLKKRLDRLQKNVAEGLPPSNNDVLKKEYKEGGGNQFATQPSTTEKVVQVVKNPRFFAGLISLFGDARKSIWEKVLGVWSLVSRLWRGDTTKAQQSKEARNIVNNRPFSYTQSSLFQGLGNKEEKEEEGKRGILGSMILQQARKMIQEKDKGDGKNRVIVKNHLSKSALEGKIKTSCWDWAWEVYERKKCDRKKVFWNKKNGDMNDSSYRRHLSSIQPGDTLIVYNGNRYGNGTHSVIFKGWVDGKVGGKIRAYSYGGGKAPPRESVYDVSHGEIRALFKPVMMA